LIVVDDGSTDGTVEALDALAHDDNRLRLVRHEEREPLGPCQARNRGIAEAKGELLAFCDDDDAWLPGIGPKAVDALQSDRRLTAVSSWHLVDHVDSGGAAVFRGPTSYGAAELLWQNVVAVPFGVIARDRLPFDISFDPALPTGEDWDLWLRCAQHGAVRTLEAVGYVYTQHAGRRVTDAVARHAEGRRNFLAKHGRDMSASCRIFHEAVLAGYDGGRPAVLRRLLGGGAVTASAQAALVLGLSTWASRRGQARGDPGYQARLMAHLVRRMTS